jgi:hypothetical protein
VHDKRSLLLGVVICACVGGDSETRIRQKQDPI